MKLKKNTLINYIYLTLEYAFIGMTALDWSTHDSEKKLKRYNYVPLELLLSSDICVNTQANNFTQKPVE